MLAEFNSKNMVDFVKFNAAGQNSDFKDEN